MALIEVWVRWYVQHHVLCNYLSISLTHMEQHMVTANWKEVIQLGTFGWLIVPVTCIYPRACVMLRRSHTVWVRVTITAARLAYTESIIGSVVLHHESSRFHFTIFPSSFMSWKPMFAQSSWQLPHDSWKSSKAVLILPSKNLFQRWKCKELFQDCICVLFYHGCSSQN